MDEKKKVFYVSLVRNLIGYCIKVIAPNENAVRKYCKNTLGRMWCSVYETNCNMTVIGSTVYIDKEGNDE